MSTVLESSVQELGELQTELEKRVNMIEKRKEEAEQAETIISLTDGQIKVVKTTLNNELQKEGWKRIRSLSYIFERYYNDKAKYKCILLPLKGESDLERFVRKYWYDLDAASSEYLDIFYSSKELNNTGFASLERIKDMTVDTKKLPCVVIWNY